MNKYETPEDYLSFITESKMRLSNEEIDGFYIRIDRYFTKKQGYTILVKMLQHLIPGGMNP